MYSFLLLQASKVVTRSQQSQQSGKLSAASSEGLAAAWSINSNENGGAPPKPTAGFNLLCHDSILPQITRLPRGAETGRTHRWLVRRSMRQRAFGKHTRGAVGSVAKRGGGVGWGSCVDGKTSDSITVINSAYG